MLTALELSWTVNAHCFAAMLHPVDGFDSHVLVVHAEGLLPLIPSGVELRASQAPLDSPIAPFLIGCFPCDLQQQWQRPMEVQKEQRRETAIKAMVMGMPIGYLMGCFRHGCNGEKRPH